jgi:hypothetical protein
MKAIQINRLELKNGMCDIENMIAEVIKADLGAKKVTVTCLTKNWQGHTCPEFTAKVDGLKLRVFGDVSQHELEVDPWNYEMVIDYILE